jgi:hypothetical protein
LLASAGSWLTVREHGTGVIIWNARTGTKIRTMTKEANGGTHAVVFSPNSKLVVIGSRTFDKDNDTSTTAVSLAHALTGLMEWQHTVPGWANPKAFSPDGKSAAVLCGGRSIRFFDTETGEVKHEIRSADSPQSGQWNDFAITPQGHQLAIAGVDNERKGSVELWDFDNDGIAANSAAVKARGDAFARLGQRGAQVEMDELVPDKLVAVVLAGKPAIRLSTATTIISASGTIEPCEVIDVRASVAGKIVSVGADPRGKSDPNYKDKLIDYGSPVGEGTILAHIDGTTIKSPVKGVIIARRVSVGQTVGPNPNGPALFLIAKDTKKMQVWAQVNEADIGRIRKRMEARFTVAEFPKDIFKGTVAQIRRNATMTQNVATYTVVIDFENPDLKLKPYQAANVQFQIGLGADTGQTSATTKPEQPAKP